MLLFCNIQFRNSINVPICSSNFQYQSIIYHLIMLSLINYSAYSYIFLDLLLASFAWGLENCKQPLNTAPKTFHAHITQKQPSSRSYEGSTKFGRLDEYFCKIFSNFGLNMMFNLSSQRTTSQPWCDFCQLAFSREKTWYLVY